MASSFGAGTNEHNKIRERGERGFKSWSSRKEKPARDERERQSDVLEEKNSPSRHIPRNLEIRVPPPSTDFIGSFSDQYGSTSVRERRGREGKRKVDATRLTDDREIRRLELPDVGFVGDRESTVIEKEKWGEFREGER